MSDELFKLIKFDLTDYDIEEFKRFESFLEFRLIMQQMQKFEPLTTKDVK